MIRLAISADRHSNEPGDLWDRCLMWGSDYPHPEGTYPSAR